MSPAQSDRIPQPIGPADHGDGIGPNGSGLPETGPDTEPFLALPPDAAVTAESLPQQSIPGPAARVLRSTVDSEPEPEPAKSFAALAPLADWSWEWVGDARHPHTRTLIGYHVHAGGSDALYIGLDNQARLFRRDARRALRVERAGDVRTLVELLTVVPRIETAETPENPGEVQPS